VDSGVAGDYTVSYAATDSTGNTHTISRLIHVLLPTYTLQWSNGATDIFALIDSYNQINDIAKTENLHTVNTGDIYLQGDYIYRCGSAHTNINDNGANGQMRHVFLNNGKNYTSMIAGMYLTSHEFGSVTGTAIDSDRTYNAGTYVYDGITINGTFIYHAQLDSVSSISYDGEYLETIFPFYVNLSSMYFDNYSTQYTPQNAHLMGTTDGGVTYQLIETFNPATLETRTYSGLPKYNGFKYIVNKGNTGVSLAVLKQWKMYGDIYSYE
jgi:hypothetical protein